MNSTVSSNSYDSIDSFIVYIAQKPLLLNMTSIFLVLCMILGMTKYIYDREIINNISLNQQILLIFGILNSVFLIQLICLYKYYKTYKTDVNRADKYLAYGTIPFWILFAILCLSLVISLVTRKNSV